MGKASYDSSSHCRFSLQYHIIWCPKFRYHVLTPDKQDSLKQILSEICIEYRYRIKALEVMDDHVHIFLSAPQTVAPCDIVRTLKSRSAIEMFRAFPELKTFYARCGALWSRGYYISTVGHVSAATVRRYIEEQKQHD